ncbi:MAG: hypothetical protein JWL83_1536 [Actinomycetia bacterium]|jgi:catechol 2,3-dioxygenase-like lactoylglutathione lyase family enzyme|nr:hypothetical protein [Actinomycetes bacterium]
MTTRGIEGLIIETHNFGKSVAFWNALGYELEFETDHHSGQLRHPSGGPYLFVVERSPADALEMQPLVGADDAASFAVPASGTLDHDFEPRHWGVTEMVVLDPDGRRISVQAPLPEGVDAPADHH